MTTGKALLGVVAGFAAGAALGLLFAPHKGTKTRRNIVEKGEELADSLHEEIHKKFNGLVGSLSGKMGKIKNEITHASKTEMMN